MGAGRAHRRAGGRARIVAMLRAAAMTPPRLVGWVGEDEVWAGGPSRDGVLFVVPAAPSWASPELAAAFDRRRRATLAGHCDCGASRTISPHGEVIFRHEDDCAAQDAMLLRLLQRDARARQGQNASGRAS